MGRKNRKKLRMFKPFCYYCDREFDDEFVLHQHQKSRHFSCYLCRKKFATAASMATHVLQVHKEHVNKVPNAKAGRDAIELDIYGMEGVPTSLIEERNTGEPVKKRKIEETERTEPWPIPSTSTDTAYLVYSDDFVSPEEKRACLPKYRVDKAKERMESIISNI